MCRKVIYLVSFVLVLGLFGNASGQGLKASSPDPPDGAESWASPLFEWTPGNTAAFHDVYLGTSSILDSSDFKGRQPGSMPMYFHAAGFAPGATYYWRVDEVEADGVTIHTGDVWSFSTAPLTAYNPDPPDGKQWVELEAELSWSAGMTAVTHDVYLGTNEADVAAGAGETFRGNHSGTTSRVFSRRSAFNPGTLNFGTAYYWRIDEVEADGTTKHEGPVWRFKTLPEMIIRDPNLVGWWKLDDVGTGTVIDYSGYGRDGTIHGNPQWVAGIYDEGLELDGDDYVTIDGYKGVTGTHPFSITAWIRKEGPTGGDGEIVGWGSTGAGNRMEFRFNAGNNRVRIECGGGNVQIGTALTTGEWQHVAVALRENSVYGDGVNFYLDGELTNWGSTDPDPIHPTADFDVIIGQRYDRSNDRWFIGALDDVRIYDKELTLEEVGRTMMGDPALAWNPKPDDGSVPDIERTTPFTWRPGELAAKHDVYFGTDSFVVSAADASDTTGTYQGRQDANNFSPSEPLEMDQIYYWRIDEFNTDGTITTGKVWTFTIGNFLIVDDMESYTNDVGSRIFQTWIDGIGFEEPPPGNPGNASGATVGHDIWNPDSPYFEGDIAETTIVQGDLQSMPLDYNNVISPFYSETDRTFDVPQDWTRRDVKSLTLWFSGVIASVGSFTEHPPVCTMVARGADIWDTSDEFHYAYKRLSGEGSITAQVFSISLTNGWAKAGVMIRDTLAPNSAHAAVYVTPNNGVAFERRLTMGDITSRDNQTEINYPHWVKLTRTGNTFTAHHSTDGATWEQLGIPETIAMGADVYIGLALTSHNVNQTCVADFYDVNITGAVSGQWQSQDIGIASNTAEQLYVAVEDSAGKSAVVKHEDPNAVLEDTWQEWNIALKDFTGVNMAAVKKMVIGVGDIVNPQPGGAGSLYVDDIRLYIPRCLTDVLKPAADLSNNCMVDYPDLEIMAEDWLLSSYPVTAEAVSDANLVAHYTFDGNANDSTGANNGVVVGNATYVEGKVGQAIHFDFDGYVAIENLYYDSTGHPEVSVMAWIRTSNPDLQKIVSFDRDEYWRLGINAEAAGDGQIQWCVMTLVDGTEVQVDYGSTTRVDDGQWHHVAGVFDNGTLTIYIDGSAEDPNTSGGITFGTGLTRYGFIGVGSEATVFNRDTGPEQYFDGDLDDVRIYSRALSHAEIANLAGVPAGETLNQRLLTILSTASDTDLHDDETINLKDYALLADTWLDEQLWPAE